MPRPPAHRLPAPPPELVAALARLQAAQPPSTTAAECDGGGDFGCAACTSAADLLGDRLSAWLWVGAGERAEFLAAGGGAALAVSCVTESGERGALVGT
jgi:hypothetical protein